MATDQVKQRARTVLPLLANAADEVARLRQIRRDLLEQREAIDRELDAVAQLLKTYVSYDPSLRAADDFRRPRARRLGETVSQILKSHPNEWFFLSDLDRAIAEKLPGVQPRDVSLRNALYHLTKTRETITSRDTDQGIQYSYSES
jgi:proteasome lid subunit RPN8/RPN11